MRMADGGRGTAAGGEGGPWPQRLADAMLGQLRWMVPAAEQPVRAATVARVAVELALRLPQAAAGTRVLAPQWLWHAAQARGAAALDALLERFLAGQPPPQARDGRRW